MKAILVCAILAIGFLQATKLLRWGWGVMAQAWRIARKGLLKPNLANLLKSAMLTGILLASEGIAEDIYTSIYDYYHPVFAGQYDTVDTEHQACIFEQELGKRNADRFVVDTVIAYTRATAQRLGVPRLWIYECALAECGLDPLVVRRDKVAASWCQLTRAGLQGIKFQGRPASLDDVMQACYRRDIATVMQFADIYMVDRWLLRGRPLMERPVDMYLLLFAPGYVGSPDDKVLYEGYGNPAYYKNAGIDGYYLDNGRIECSTAARDGKITVRELALRQEKIKNSLLKTYLQ